MIIFEKLSHWFILVWLNIQIVTMYDLRSYFIHIQTPSEEVFNCLLHAVKILFYTWYHRNIDKCKNKYNKTPRYVPWYVFQDIVFEKTIKRQWFDPLNNIWSQWERRNYICNSNKTRTDLEYCFIIGGLATALKCCNRHRVIPNIIICYRKLYRFKSHLLRTNTV